MDPALALEVAVLSKQKFMNDVMSQGDSEVQNFYNNSVVFITGGSGFLGKQLIEKLFRSCEISKMFVMLRSKKGKRVQERLDEMLKDPGFEILRQKKPNFSDKITIIEGDAAEIRLGIKDADWKTLTEEVNVIFHVAATTRFDESLRSATLINVRGTMEGLLLGKSCKKLRSYVHVSTAYTNATGTLIGEEIREEFYTTPVPPEALISMAEDMDPERLNNVTTNLVKDWPNTYTFTKAVAEDLLRTTSVGLPICIVRPGIVLSSYREPSPGWLDMSCVYGATGILVGIALGVMHTILVNSDNKLAIVPCDYVNNAIIVAGRETATSQAKGGDDTRIYTVTTTRRNPATWGLFSKVLNSDGRKIATPKSIYYCCSYDTSNRLLYMIYSVLLHFIPSYIADFVCLCMRKERRFVKMAKKVNKMCNVLSYFLLNEWQFIDNNLHKLYNNLSKKDKTIFNFDVADINWKEYTLIWTMGTRKYIFKDELKITEYGVKKQKYFKIAHYLIVALYVYGLWKLAYFVFHVISV